MLTAEHVTVGDFVAVSACSSMACSAMPWPQAYSEAASATWLETADAGLLPSSLLSKHFQSHV